MPTAEPNDSYLRRIETMIQKYITYLRSIRGYSENTCRAYEHDLRQFAAYIITKKYGARWSTIDRHDIDAYIIYLKEKGNASSTTNRVIASISSLYNYFHRENLLTENPCKFESRAKIGETIPNTIPIKDIVKAYDHARGVTRTMIGLLATTGIRLQEMLDMRWEDIDFSSNSIKIHGKGKRERIVYTTSSVMEPLAQVAKQLPVHGKMFYQSQRKVRYMMYEALRPYTRAEKISPHIIRHSYATELARHGYNAVTISKALGHKRLDTTQRYIDMAQVEIANRNLLNTLN